METKCSYRHKQTATVTLPAVICYWDQRDCQESSRGHEHRVQSGMKDHMRLSWAPLTELLWFLHSCSGADGLCHLLVLILQRDGVWQDGTAAHTHWRKEISGLYVIIMCRTLQQISSPSSASDHKHKPLYDSTTTAVKQIAALCSTHTAECCCPTETKASVFILTVHHQLVIQYTNW